MKRLIGFSKTEMAQELENIGLKPFRAAQIYNHIFVRGITDFSKMTDLSKETQKLLSENYSLARPEISFDKTASDGTRKWVVKFADGNCVEVVFIPEETRGTLCISSQVGCTLACKFCHTGTQTLVRNLTTEEILAQILLAKDCLGDWGLGVRNDALAKEVELQHFQHITNIVFMGMGEPFYNYENVKKSIEILLDHKGLNFAAKRITVSTSGLVPEILRAANELKTTLAISLHATNDKVRSEIMAINKKYPLDELMKACKKYNSENKNHKITFEYVLLKGVNDSDESAFELANLIKKYNLNAKINLIPFNPWMSCGFEKSDPKRILQFQKILKDAGLVAPIRKTRGDDVMAACGQLKSDSIRLKQNFRK